MIDDDMQRLPVSRPTSGPAAVPGLTPTQCDECGAPVDEEQRYCVVCGSHRRHVADPAARYLSQATARSRAKRSPAVGATRRVSAQRGGRARGLGVVVGLAIIPAAAAVGVLIGHSNDNNDAQLIKALSKQQAAVARATAAGPVAASSSTGSTGAASTSASKAGGGATASSSTTTHHKTAGKSGNAGKSHTSKAGAHHGGASKRASSSSAASTSAPPTAAAKKTGASVTQKVQNTKGQSYVKQQSSLPGTVVVP